MVKEKRKNKERKLKKRRNKRAEEEEKREENMKIHVHGCVWRNHRYNRFRVQGPKESIDFCTGTRIDETLDEKAVLFFLLEHAGNAPLSRSNEG